MKIHANRLPKYARYLGYSLDWYDGPIYCFGFWFWHVYLYDR